MNNHLNALHHLKTSQEGVLIKIVVNVSFNARVVQDLVIMSRTHLMGLEYGQ